MVALGASLANDFLPAFSVNLRPKRCDQEGLLAGRLPLSDPKLPLAEGVSRPASFWYTSLAEWMELLQEITTRGSQSYPR